MRKEILRSSSFLMAVIFIARSVAPVYGAPLLLPAPGNMVALSAAPSTPVIIKGMVIHPDDPLKFDFLMDTGTARASGDQLRQEAERSIKYFLASLTVPEEDLWVNLSPYEKDRVVPEAFGQTEMGRDVLAGDYVLKQLTSSLLHPDGEVGRVFWERIYKEAGVAFGPAAIPVDTLNRVWIVPSQAQVWEHDRQVMIVNSHLKVMLETDHLAMQVEAGQAPAAAPNATQQSANQIMREVVLPAVEKEVNDGAQFARLRQVTAAMVLSAWYKIRFKESLLVQAYANKNKVTGVGFSDGLNKADIYDRYLETVKKGIFNYIREESDPVSGEVVPRRYFSGGFVGKAIRSLVLAGMLSGAIATLPANAQADVRQASLPQGNMVLVEAGVRSGENGDKAMISVAPSAHLWPRKLDKFLSALKNGFVAPLAVSGELLRADVTRNVLWAGAAGLSVASPQVIQAQETVPRKPLVAYVQPGDKRLMVRKIMPDGTLDGPEAFIAKGISRTLPSRFYDKVSFTQDFYNWYVQDIPLMIDMGVNSVRLESFLLADPRAAAMLDAFYKRQIKIIPVIPLSNFDTEANTQVALAIVRQFKDHPAILLWEVPAYTTGDTPSPPKIEVAAQKIKQVDPVHLVSAPFAVGTDGTWRLGQWLLENAPSVDIWGPGDEQYAITVEESSQWRHRTAKPCYQSTMGWIWNWDQMVQLDLSAERMNGNMIGGFYPLWAGGPSFPSNEGALVSNDRTTVTALYAKLRDRYRDNLQPTLVAQPRLDIGSGTSGYVNFSEYYLNGVSLYRNGGGNAGGRGITLAVLDTHTGMRFDLIENFDTWQYTQRFADLISLIDSLPNGSVFALAISDEGGLWKTDAVVEEFRKKIESLGSTKVRQVGQWSSWILVVRKGTGVLRETVGPSRSTLNESITLSITPDINFGLRPTPFAITQVPLMENGGRMIIGDSLAFTGKYTVESSPDLTHWTAATTGLAATRGRTYYTIPNPQTAPRQFYRARQNPAQKAAVGGIDLDARKLDLQIKRDGKGVPLPLGQQSGEMINIQGFAPVIYRIMPVDAGTCLGSGAV